MDIPSGYPDVSGATMGDSYTPDTADIYGDFSSLVATPTFVVTADDVPKCPLLLYVITIHQRYRQTDVMLAA